MAKEKYINYTNVKQDLYNFKNESFKSGKSSHYCSYMTYIYEQLFVWIDQKKGRILTREMVAKIKQVRKNIELGKNPVASKYGGSDEFTEDEEKKMWESIDAFIKKVQDETIVVKY